MSEVSDEVKELLKNKKRLASWVNSPMWTSAEKARFADAIKGIDEKLKRLR